MAMAFVVTVRCRDALGRVERVAVRADSRYIAARLGERIAAGGTGPAVAASVSVLLDGDALHSAPDESCGECDYVVAVRGRRGVVRVIPLRATSRAEALREAEGRIVGGEAVSARVTFGIVGRCATCGIPLFADVPVRQTPRGLKCGDCG